jgi:hypothetical protein
MLDFDLVVLDPERLDEQFRQAGEQAAQSGHRDDGQNADADMIGLAKGLARERRFG